MGYTVNQQKHVFSIPRQEFLTQVVYNQNLSKKDLRVCLMLLTQLNGHNYNPNNSSEDPCNFIKIDTEEISKTLSIKEKDVKESIKTLIQNDILEKGKTPAAKNGYRFLF